MSEIESWMVPQSERQLAERHDNELRAAIRAALEAAAREAAFYGYEVTAGRMFADRICQRIRNLSPDDILKRL